SLFLKRLDANGDGKLSAAELRRAPRTFRKYDLNEDEGLDRAELLAGAPTGQKPGAVRLKLGGASGKAAVLRIDLEGKGTGTWREGGKEKRLKPLGEGVYRVRGPGGWWLTFRAERAAPDVRAAGEFLLAQFETALGDEKSLSRAALQADATLACFLDLM